MTVLSSRRGLLASLKNQVRDPILPEYKMKKNMHLLAPVVALALGISAHAQLFNSAAGDVIFVVHDATAGVTLNDLEFDLGSVSTFQNASSAFTVSKTVGTTGTDITSTLTSVFGTTIPGGLKVNFFAAKTESDSTRTIFASRQRVGGVSGQQGTENAWVTKTSGVNILTAGNIGSVQSNAKTYSQSFPGMASQGFVAIPNSNLKSYTTLAGTLGRFGSGSNTHFQGNTEAQSTTGQYSSDFFYLPSTASSVASTYLGNFTLSSAGVITYTPASAVPEPSSYAMFGACSLLGYAIWRRRASK